MKTPTHTRFVELRSDSGQTIVEFAIVLPILVLLLFGISQFGVAFHNYLAITDAARVGARAAAVKRTTTPCTFARTAIQNTVSSAQWTQISSRITLRRRPERGRPRHDHDQLPVHHRSSRVQRLGESDRERQGADGMRASRLRLRRDSGQAMVFIAVMLTGLVGMAALVVDVGSWYQRGPKGPDRGGRSCAGRRTAPPDGPVHGAVGRDRLRAAQLRRRVRADADVSDRRRDRRHGDGDDAGILRPRHQLGLQLRHRSRHTRARPSASR